MELMPDNSDSARITVGRIRPMRLATGVYEVRWKDAARSRRVLLAPADPLRPTAAEVIDAVRSAYPPRRRPDVTIPERAWR